MNEIERRTYESQQLLYDDEQNEIHDDIVAHLTKLCTVMDTDHTPERMARNILKQILADRVNNLQVVY